MPKRKRPAEARPRARGGLLSAADDLARAPVVDDAIAALDSRRRSPANVSWTTIARMAMVADYGSVLCHYTTSAKTFEDILPERQLRFSPYGRMRDPTESGPWIFPAAFSPDSFDDRDDEDATYGLAHEVANELKRQAKLLAFTEDVPGGEPAGLSEQLFSRGWARARMWEHYGDDHRGTCLIFDREKLDEELTTGLAANGVDSWWSGEVRYTRAGLAGAPVSFHLDDFKKNPPEEAMARHLDRHKAVMFFLKTLDWESEHEYRYVTRRADDDYLCVQFEDSLIAVVVGRNFPGWQVSGALEACQGAGATAYRLEWLHEGPHPVRLERERSEMSGPVQGGRSRSE